MFYAICGQFTLCKYQTGRDWEIFLLINDWVKRFFSQLSDEEQQLIKLNVVGGFQTEQRKSNWDADTKGECVFCGQADTRQHRLLECPFLWNYVGIIKPHAKFYRVRGLSGFFYHYQDNMTIQDC